MNLEGMLVLILLILSEISHTEKDKYYLFSVIYGIEKRKQRNITKS